MRPLKWAITTPPTTEPVTVAELKAACKVDLSAEDTLLAIYLTAAREKLENQFDLQFCTATIAARADSFCGFNDWIELPRPPLRAVTSIGYVNGDGTSTTWTASEYSVDAVSKPGRVAPAYGYIWPTARKQLNSVTITYTTGFGGAADVPKNFKAAIILLASFYERNRMAASEKMLHEMPFGVNELMESGWHGFL